MANKPVRRIVIKNGCSNTKKSNFKIEQTTPPFCQKKTSFCCSAARILSSRVSFCLVVVVVVERVISCPQIPFSLRLPRTLDPRSKMNVSVGHRVMAPDTTNNKLVRRIVIKNGCSNTKQQLQNRTTWNPPVLSKQNFFLLLCSSNPLSTCVFCCCYRCESSFAFRSRVVAGDVGWGSFWQRKLNKDPSITLRNVLSGNYSSRLAPPVVTNNPPRTLVVKNGFCNTKTATSNWIYIENKLLRSVKTLFAELTGISNLIQMFFLISLAIVSHLPLLDCLLTRSARLSQERFQQHKLIFKSNSWKQTPPVPSNYFLLLCSNPQVYFVFLCQEKTVWHWPFCFFFFFPFSFNAVLSNKCLGVFYRQQTLKFCFLFDKIVVWRH